MLWALVAAGGAVGSMLRYGVGRLALHYLGAGALWGTLAVNVTGSFALGFFVAYAQARGGLSLHWQALAGVGLLGGYTTFSAFGYDTLRLLESGDVARAGMNVAGNLALGVLAAYLGVLAGRSM